MKLKNSNSLNVFIKLIRPKQWVKNLLIFLPSILAGNVFKEFHWLLGLAGFVSFSLMASAGYILNDIRDIDKDRQHPVKKNRPLAAATIKVKNGFFLSLILIISSLGIAYSLGLKPLLVLAVYFIINWIYSAAIKSVRFLDIIILTSFYIIRLTYGATITQTELTGWFIITVTFTCLALSLNKRQMECYISKTEKIPGREYTTKDISLLQILSIGFGICSLVFLNIHSYFVLQVKNPLTLASRCLTPSASRKLLPYGLASKRSCRASRQN